MAFITSIPLLASSRNIRSHEHIELRRPLLSFGVPSVRRSHVANARNVCSMTATSPSPSLTDVLESAKDLGTVRFISISNGAVLETIGRFDYGLSNFSVPGKGDYVTIASADKTFECHLNTSKVARVTFSTEKAKMGGHDLHVMRLKGDDDSLVLSCLLMWDPSVGPGNYLHGAVEEFEKLKNKFGEDISLAV